MVILDTIVITYIATLHLQLITTNKANLVLFIVEIPTLNMLNQDISHVWPNTDSVYFIIFKIVLRVQSVTILRKHTYTKTIYSSAISMPEKNVILSTTDMCSYGGHIQ